MGNKWRTKEHIKHISESITNPKTEDYKDNCPNGFDYLEDALDINFIVSSNGDYIGAEVLVAFGGPNIWIHTRSNTIKGYWWGDNAETSYEDNIGLDEALEELYNCK